MQVSETNSWVMRTILCPFLKIGCVRILYYFSDVIINLKRPEIFNSISSSSL
jgi:hypothetical protein